MAKDGVQIKVNHKRLSIKVKELEQLGSNQITFWEAVGEIMVRSVQKNFDAGGRKKKWKKLRPSTIARKGSSKPLIDTAEMMNSVNYQATALGVSVGTSGVDYAGHHQYGAPKANIPKRPFLVFHNEDREAAAATFADMIDEIFE